MTFIVDGTLEGVLTAVFNAYYIKEFPSALSDGTVQMEIGSKIIEIITDTDKSSRVFKKINEILPHKEVEKLYVAIRSGDPARFTIIFNYVRKTIDNKKDISLKFSDVDVFNFDRLVTKVLYEVHRLKGFIRFSKTQQGIYYAKYQPDNDVTALIFPHFIERFKDMPFILHDVKNDVIAGYYNGKKKIINKEIKALSIKDDFAKLFKTYYDTVYIPERKNERCMKNFLPKRYHKNLPERDELLF